MFSKQQLIIGLLHFGVEKVLCTLLHLLECILVVKLVQIKLKGHIKTARAIAAPAPATNNHVVYSPMSSAAARSKNALCNY